MTTRGAVEPYLKGYLAIQLSLLTKSYSTSYRVLNVVFSWSEDRHEGFQRGRHESHR